MCKGTRLHSPGIFASAAGSEDCSSIDRISSTRDSSSMHFKILKWKLCQSSHLFDVVELGADEMLPLSSKGDREGRKIGR